MSAAGSGRREFVEVLVLPLAAVIWASLAVLGLLIRLALLRTRISKGATAVLWGLAFAAYLWAGSRAVGLPEGRAVPFACASWMLISLFVFLRGGALEDAPVGRPSAFYRRLATGWRAANGTIQTSSSDDLQAVEQTRWLTWFGVPAVIAAASLGLVFATGRIWYLAVVFIAFLADVCALIWLGLTSDRDHPTR